MVDPPGFVTSVPVSSVAVAAEISAVLDRVSRSAPAAMVNVTGTMIESPGARTDVMMTVPSVPEAAQA